MRLNRSGKTTTQRQLRVGEMIKQSLGIIFSKNEAKVPELETNDITVTEVKMSQDLKVAKAFVLPLGGHDAEQKIEKSGGTINRLWLIRLKVKILIVL